LAIVIKASGNRKDWPSSPHGQVPPDASTGLSFDIVFAAVDCDTHLTRGEYLSGMGHQG
jgi:hypothetical protein